jgi:hypothetical protein
MILPNTPLQEKKFQDTAVNKIVDILFTKDLSSCGLSAPTGHGKTLLYGRAMVEALENWIPKTFSADFIKQRPVPILFLSPAQVVVQTRRRLRDFFGLVDMEDYWIIPYSSLAATLGSFLIERKLESVNGEIQEVFLWKKKFAPLFIVCDENHYLMKESSIRHKIVANYYDMIEGAAIRNEPLRHCKVLMGSATFAARVSEFKSFAVSTRIPYQYGYVKTPLTNKHWPTFAKEHSWDSDPHDHNTEACRRIIKTLREYIVVVPYQDCGDRWRICVEKFSSPESWQRYKDAYEEYLKKLEDLGEELKGIEIFHVIREFCKAAEREKLEIIAKKMKDAWDNGEAPSCALLFKINVIRLYKILIKEYGVSVNDIALIWGGVNDKIIVESDREDLENKQEDEETVDKDLDILEQEETDEDKEWLSSADPELAAVFSGQSMISRQKDIDAFQDGSKTFLLHTYAAGGTGLDLPQDKPTLRPRHKFIGIIYHDKQFLQSNREARITSLSNTYIDIILLDNTIEVERVLPRLKRKLSCLREMMGGKKNFADALVPSNKASIVEELERLNEGKDNVDVIAELSDEPERKLIEDEPVVVPPTIVLPENIKVVKPSKECCVCHIDSNFTQFDFIAQGYMCENCIKTRDNTINDRRSLDLLKETEPTTPQYEQLQIEDYHPKEVEPNPLECDRRDLVQVSHEEPSPTSSLPKAREIFIPFGRSSKIDWDKELKEV